MHSKIYDRNTTYCECDIFNFTQRNNAVVPWMIGILLHTHQTAWRDGLFTVRNHVYNNNSNNNILLHYIIIIIVIIERYVRYIVGYAIVKRSDRPATGFFFCAWHVRTRATTINRRRC